MTKLTRPCADCGIDISGLHGNAKRCKPCAEARKPKNPNPVVRPTWTRICRVCQVSFETQSNRAKYCSIACRMWAKSHPGEPRPTPGPCPTCSGPVVGARAGRIYCSPRCRSAAQKRRALKREAKQLLLWDKPNPVKLIKSCRTCREDFESAWSHQRFCGARCRRKDRYQRTRDRAIAYSMQWVSQNRAKHRRYAYVWASRNRKRVNEMSRKWYWRNPETARMQARLSGGKRKARRLGGDSVGVSARDWQRLVRRHRGCCVYCGEPASPVHMDHVIPLARGGRHAIGNVVPACGPCNLSKHDAFLVEWKRRKSWLTLISATATSSNASGPSPDSPATSRSDGVRTATGLAATATYATK